MGHVQRALTVVVCAGALGCGSHGPRHVSDEDPGDKIPAIKAAVQNHDSRAIPQLVTDLESDDPAVRFYAIDALKTFTGQTFGYRYYEDDEHRKPAITRWKEWLKSSGFGKK
jgi:hypothetical protein